MNEKLKKMEKKSNTLQVYTDGGCRPTNPGPGAWGYAYVIDDEEITSHAGFEKETTNNRMEMKAALNAIYNYHTFSLLHLNGKYNIDRIEILSDSQYVCKGITVWIVGWKNRDGENSSNKTVENLDLWKELDHAVQFIKNSNIEINFTWVKGHNGNKFNEIVDQLCTKCINENKDYE